MENRKKLKPLVRWWLITGLAMVFFQVLLGGITRLTGSGLSITKWEIVTGTIPPIGEAQWTKEFELYKQTPQYHHINQGMSLGEFKFIFFWEFIHRLWARTMGFVFIFPLIYFLFKRYIDKTLGRQLINVFLLAAIVASVGWIMVASGLINRPWVNAYKLSFHLILAVILFSYLLWIILSNTIQVATTEALRRYSGSCLLLVILVFIQIFLGGMMSGMKAALMYPTWPKIGSEYFPSLLLDGKQWKADNLIFYDKNIFMPTIVQFVHRWVAYIIFVYGIYVSYRMIKEVKNKLLTFWSRLLISLLVIQVVLGVLTLINSIGKIPLLLGVLHQATGILLLGSCLSVYFVVSGRGDKNVSNSVS